jgi:hypothetical protein
VLETFLSVILLTGRGLRLGLVVTAGWLVAIMAPVGPFPGESFPLPDGRLLATSRSGASQVEVYDAAADSWTVISRASRYFPELYPSLHQLPSGQI